MLDMLVSEKISLRDPNRWDDQNDRFYMDLYKKHCNCKSIYAFCTSLSLETYHHWRVFTPTDQGACIKFLRKPLEAELKKKQNVKFGEVEYRSLRRMQKSEVIDPEQLPFLKRSGFKPEKEYRIILKASEDQALVKDLDIEINWIHRIVLNPWMSESVFESVKCAIRSLPGCESTSIMKSTLVNNSAWQKFGEDILERVKL